VYVIIFVLRIRNIPDKNFGENKKTVYFPFFSFKSDVYAPIWKYVVRPDRPQMAI
jgi:hypothetical protein